MFLPHFTHTRGAFWREICTLILCVTDIWYCFIVLFCAVYVCLHRVPATFITNVYFSRPWKKFRPKSLNNIKAFAPNLWGAADVMNVKTGKFYLNFRSLIFHVMLATVRYRWGGFLPNSSMRCIECQSTHFWKPWFFYNPGLVGNWPHSHNYVLGYTRSDT
jgi:hypothetical protein